MPWRKKLIEDNPYARLINPVHYRQMPTTAACGQPLIDLLINRTEVMEEVTCPMCADVRTNIEAKLSKLGHSQKADQS